jgi:hypothetical protein
MGTLQSRGCHDAVFENVLFAELYASFWYRYAIHATKKRDH